MPFFPAATVGKSCPLHVPLRHNLVPNPGQTLPPRSDAPVICHPGQTPAAEMSYAVKSPPGQMTPPAVKRLPIR